MPNTSQLISVLEQNTFLSTEEKVHYMTMIPMLDSDQQMELFLMLSGGNQHVEVIEKDRELRVAGERKKFLGNFQMVSKKSLRDGVEHYHSEESSHADEMMDDSFSKL